MGKNTLRVKGNMEATLGGEECREGQNRALEIELGHRVKTLLPGNLWSGEGVKALNADAKKAVERAS